MILTKEELKDKSKESIIDMCIRYHDLWEKCEEDKQKIKKDPVSKKDYEDMIEMRQNRYKEVLNEKSTKKSDTDWREECVKYGKKCVELEIKNAKLEANMGALITKIFQYETLCLKNSTKIDAMEKEIKLLGGKLTEEYKNCIEPWRITFYGFGHGNDRTEFEKDMKNIRDIMDDFKKSIKF